MRHRIFCLPVKLLDSARALDFLGPLAVRFYLAPVFWMSGMQKFLHMHDTITWFGNLDWGLGLPFPTVMAYLTASAEVVGALCLLVGFGVRFIVIPLMIVMVVAAVTVHWENGWFAIAHHSSEATRRLQEFMVWLENTYPKRHDFITELGSPVILNNGIEFAATYFVMLFSLFFTGAGKYLSIDYWIDAHWGCSKE